MWCSKDTVEIRMVSRFCRFSSIKAIRVSVMCEFLSAISMNVYSGLHLSSCITFRYQTATKLEIDHHMSCSSCLLDRNATDPPHVCVFRNQQREDFMVASEKRLSRRERSVETLCCCKKSYG